MQRWRLFLWKNKTFCINNDVNHLLSYNLFPQFTFDPVIFTTQRILYFIKWVLELKQKKSWKFYSQCVLFCPLVQIKLWICLFLNFFFFLICCVFQQIHTDLTVKSFNPKPNLIWLKQKCQLSDRLSGLKLYFWSEFLLNHNISVDFVVVMVLVAEGKKKENVCHFYQMCMLPNRFVYKIKELNYQCPYYEFIFYVLNVNWFNVIKTYPTIMNSHRWSMSFSLKIVGQMSANFHICLVPKSTDVWDKLCRCRF